MARNQRYDRPVSEEEYEQMPERISEAFDEIQELLREEDVDVEAARERAANGEPPERDDSDTGDK